MNILLWYLIHVFAVTVVLNFMRRGGYMYNAVD